MTWQLDDPLGEAPCPRCKRTVMFAWDDDMEAHALDPDEAGGIAVSLDGNRLPWCRLVTGGQFALDESPYRLHDPVCPAIRPVADLAAVRRSRRRARPAPERRHASAR